MTFTRFISFAAFAALASASVSAPALAADAPAGATPAASTPATDPEALALAHQIVSTAFPPERLQAMMDKIMHTMIGQMKAGMNLDQFTDPGLRKILDDYLEDIPNILRPSTEAYLPKQMDAIAIAYTHMFTTAQLRDILAFAKTPSGAAYLSRSADLLSDPAMAAVNVEYFKQTQGLLKTSQANLVAKMVEYAKAHPDAMKDKSATSDGK